MLLDPLEEQLDRKHPAKAAGDRRCPDVRASGMASCDQAA
jgi:hypothetical protein